MTKDLGCVGNMLLAAMDVVPVATMGPAWGNTPANLALAGIGASEYGAFEARLVAVGAAAKEATA